MIALTWKTTKTGCLQYTPFVAQLTFRSKHQCTSLYSNDENTSL